MQIHGVSEAVPRIEVEQFTPEWAALVFPGGVRLVLQSHEDIDRLIIAAAEARELLPAHAGRTVHLLRADLSIGCPTDYAPLCSSVVTEVTCTFCLAGAVDAGLCNLPTPDGPCQAEAGHHHLAVVPS